ncbi:hypothetical protein LINPERPRIM_LOCUS20928 [Linum perenne]
MLSPSTTYPCPPASIIVKMVILGIIIIEEVAVYSGYNDEALPNLLADSTKPVTATGTQTLTTPPNLLADSTKAATVAKLLTAIATKLLTAMAAKIRTTTKLLTATATKLL